MRSSMDVFSGITKVFTGGEDDLLNVEGAGEVDKNQVANVDIDKYDKEPYYFHSDDTKAGYLNNHNLALAFNPDSRPTVQAQVHTCQKPREVENVIFEQGMWVEYRSNDMRWKVGVVNRVIKRPPEDWDFDAEGADPPPEKMIISYNVGVEGSVSSENIRAPEIGLRWIFGQRPWLWQQFTILQLERRLRFDRYHEFDFDTFDFMKFASKRYDAWLNAPENADFKELHDTQLPITQQLLQSHLLGPFALMDEMIRDDDAWDFADEDMSVYTYVSVLGSGFLMSGATLIVQVLSPILLLYNAFLQADGDPNPRFDIDEDTGLPENGNLLPGTTFEKFCNTEGDLGRVEGSILLCLVLILYTNSVLPDGLLRFYRTSGGADSTYSKVNSIRAIIWEQNDDSITQQIGLKLDRIMKTGYVALLYSIMLFILVNTPNVLDIILNALAIEFIDQIDERLGGSEWWDSGNRYLRAGTIELVMQEILSLRVLEDPARICNDFDINVKDYENAVGGMKPLYDPKEARKDELNTQYMTRKERIYDAVAKQAIEKRNRQVLSEYQKREVQFSLVGKVQQFFGVKQNGLFRRYLSYRVWSRWEKILFLPRLPDQNASRLALDDKRASNVVIGKSDFTEFLNHVVRVLSFKDLFASVIQVGRHGYYAQVPLKILLGTLEIFFYFVQLVFPVFVVFGVFFLPFCY